MPQPPVNLVEYQGLPFQGDMADLAATAGVSAERLAKLLEPLVSLRRSLEGGTICFQAGSQIGSVQIGGLRVNVFPRMAAAEVATLIRYAYGGDLGWQRSEIGLDRVGLDELLCIVLADELSAVRQKGLSRQYVSRRDRLEVLRGRPDFLASFPWNDKGMTSIACRYHELTCDNLDNQLVRAGLKRGVLLEASTRTRRQLLEHLHVWNAVASDSSAGSADFAVARARYTRLSEHYRLAHTICEVILSGRRPEAAFEVGPTVTSGLCLNMAELFELFVTRLLAERLSTFGLTVRSQMPDRGAFLDGNGDVYRRVRPDVVVFSGKVPVAVIDAKYKDYWAATGASASPSNRVGNEDLYQLFFYAQRLQNRYQLGSAPAAFIICPVPTDDERAGQVPIADQYRHIQWRAGADDGGAVHIVLLPLTDLLRDMRRRSGHTLADVDSLLHRILGRTSGG